MLDLIIKNKLKSVLYELGQINAFLFTLIYENSLVLCQVNLHLNKLKIITENSNKFGLDFDYWTTTLKKIKRRQDLLGKKLSSEHLEELRKLSDILFDLRVNVDLEDLAKW